MHLSYEKVFQYANADVCMLFELNVFSLMSVNFYKIRFQNQNYIMKIFHKRIISWPLHMILRKWFQIFIFGLVKVLFWSQTLPLISNLQPLAPFTIIRDAYIRSSQPLHHHFSFRPSRKLEKKRKFWDSKFSKKSREVPEKNCPT